MVIKTTEDIRNSLTELNLDGDTVLVKPNWVAGMPGGFTDAKIIDWVLTALEGKKVIFIESYAFWRTDKKVHGGADYFSSREATLKTGKQHWDHFQKMDRWFLDFSGIKRVLAKHGAEYLNVTNEVWAERTADPNLIRLATEGKFGRIKHEELYGYVPERLWQLRGAPLLSLAKAKYDLSYGASLSIKNMFGLIPDPSRYVKYHGKDETGLVQSIIDINRVYQAVFECKYIAESVFETCVMDWDSETSERKPGSGMWIAGNDGAEVDMEALEVMGAKFEGTMAGLLNAM